MVRIVKCIENRVTHLEANNITHGKEYGVLMEDDGFYRLRDDSGDLGWFLMRRFEEVKEPALQDLLVKAKELYDKGILRSYGEANRSEDKTLRVEFVTSEGGFYFIFSDSTAHKGLKYLQSLEVETFKIETEKDLTRVKPNAKLVLSNGEEFTICNTRARTQSGRLVVIGEGYYNESHLNFKIVKGATITQ